MRVDNSNFHKTILISGVLISVLSLILMSIKVDYVVYSSTILILFVLFKIYQNFNNIDNLYAYVTLALIYMFLMGIGTLLIGIIKAFI